MRRKYKKKSGIGIIAFVVLVLCGIVSYRRIYLEEESEKARLRIERLESQKKEQEERATDIENMKAYVQTKQYIEDMAREKLGLVYEDEIIFKPEK
ncbi:septum formation initiator family protein [Lachnospiraceae bacterium MD1]|jgi:cell division protein DivIC|uniref:Septum formation initiator family protein n=1 Tax=Variimorphobacter saccharofermentans TaxID=2755051 RepID=A0A839K3P4_9FIRM|nr:septum formation initiator family protein [Variimorphobacter saccharofermentans]MBB2184525.1 septum formation initiator family protein [Variimorphobacter saccharofermentans]